MEAIVLAGGYGTRLREIVPSLPKPMAPVAGRPFLAILLASLAKKGFKRVVLSVGFMADKISNYFGSEYLGMQLIYEVEYQPMGTGGALRLALSNCQSDHIFVFNGDTFVDLEVIEMEKLWQANHVPSIVVREVQDASRFGSVIVDGGRVISFLDKGIAGAGMINAGCYLVPKNLLDEFELGTSFSLESEFFYGAVRLQKINGFVTHGLFIDIGVPDDYRLAQTLLANV